MKLFGQVLIFLSVVFLVSACQGKKKTASLPQVEHQSLRHIDSGDVVGSLTPAGAYQWAGIPYAAPPVGDLRWRAPRPLAPWDGTLEALDMSKRCVQRARSADTNDDLGTLVGDEDCLYLNVWAPANAANPVSKDKPGLPVMVFIHGGSNVWGYGGQYDSEYLSTRENLVVVTINYRLGPFGWFAHPALRASAKSADDKSPNFADLDMIAALQWVKRNIGAFGGDANSVTIFGESAGGHDVASLIALPRAQGLFKGAIIESGYFTSRSMDEAENGVKKGAGWDYKGAKAVVAALSPKDGLDPAALADFMRSASARDIYEAAQENNETEPGSPLIIADNILLTAPSLEAALDNPAFPIVPVITGTNRDETKLFNITNPKLVKKFLGFLPRPRNKRVYALQAEYESATWRLRSVDTQARRLSAHNQAPVFTYRFDWDEEGSFLGTDMALLLGAGHAMELPFVFNGFATFPVGNGAVFPKSGAKERDALSSAIMGYWANFAKTGTPGKGTNGQSPLWPAWNADNDGPVMILDTASDGGIRLSQNSITVESLVGKLDKDSRFKNIKETCQALAGMIGWFPEIRAEIRRAAHTDCKN